MHPYQLDVSPLPVGCWIHVTQLDVGFMDTLRCALLISSHFDSALGSPAASDANVTSMKDLAETISWWKTSGRKDGT